MKNIYSRHLRDFVFRALLSLLTCVAGTLHAGTVTPRNPIAKVTNLNYTKTNTIVTLKLWMYNFDGDNAHFVGDVWLTIDGKKRKKLNECWSLISNVENEDKIKNLEWDKISEAQYILAWDNEHYGDLEFGKLSKNQQCPDNKDKSEKKWSTAEIKLTFKKVFPYYGHKITIEGTWRDRCDDKKKADKYWSIDNEIEGYVRPAEVKAGPSGSDVVLSWQKQGYNKSSKANGKWVVYKVDGKDYAKLVEKPVGDCSYAIPKKKFECGGTYCIAFLPDGFNAATPASGLSAELILGGHAEKNDVCQRCGHGFMHYKTRLKEMVRLPKNADFGAVIVSHKNEGDCKFVIECDGPITRIPSDAFSAVQNCLKDDNLSIPTTVTHIGDRAFCRNALLTGKLVIPPSVKSIGREAFMGTNFSGDLVIPNSVGSIGYGAFSACNGFNGTLTLHEGLETIGKNAFSSCDGLTGDLNIPQTVRKISEGAFNNCSGFNGTLTLPDKLERIEPNAFYSCGGLKGNLVIPSTVTIIGEYAFFSCKGFTGNLVIPNSVTVIGPWAFYNCNGFKGTLTLSDNLERIGDNTFGYCDGLTGTLVIPGTVTAIGASAFYGCDGFGDLVLPNSIAVIPEKAFSRCRGLKNNVVIPASVKEIGSQAFAYSSEIPGLEFSNGLTTIGNDAFWNCRGLKGTVTLPPSLESISEYSFADCGKVTAFEFKSLPRGMKEMLSHATVHRSVRLSDASYVSEADNSGASIDELSYTRDNPGQWNTLVLPCDLTLTGEENHVLYKIDKVDDDKLVVSQVKDKVAAGTPCLFLCGKSDQKAVTITANKVVLDMTLNTVNVDGLTFIGTYHTQKPVEGWVFSGNMFVNIDNLPAKEEGYSVSPFSAWLEGAVQGNPWSLGLKVNNPATGIAPVTVVDTLNGEGVEYYDLSGQRLDAPRQGVNIVRLKSGKAKKLIIK
uniref:leucine-rich repeat domain-containing protein n=1 Tax=Prevotella sp. TaxID=59823 RepID=UPI004024EC2E